MPKITFLTSKMFKTAICNVGVNWNKWTLIWLGQNGSNLNSKVGKACLKSTTCKRCIFVQCGQCEPHKVIGQKKSLKIVRKFNHYSFIFAEKKTLLSKMCKIIAI